MQTFRSRFLILLNALVFVLLALTLALWVRHRFEDLPAFLGLFLTGVFALVMQVRARRIEAKTRSLELFFLGLFYFGLSFEVLRLWYLAASPFHLGAAFKVGLVRALHFFRALSALSFFVSSLFFCGWGYRRSSRIVPTLVALSLAVAGTLPVSSEHTGADGLYRVVTEDLFRVSLAFFVGVGLAARLAISLHLPEKGRWEWELLLAASVLCWFAVLYWDPLLAVAPLSVSGYLYTYLSSGHYRGG